MTEFAARITAGRQEYDWENQIRALTELVGGLVSKIDVLQEQSAYSNPGNAGHNQAPGDPAEWVVLSPRDAERRRGQLDRRAQNRMLDDFVSWYNNTFAGLPGGSTRPIPACWREHGGLANEVATLAYSWHRANIGPLADVRAAQYWHDTVRPGFTDRLIERVHPHCFQGTHRDISIDEVDSDVLIDP